VVGHEWWREARPAARFRHAPNSIIHSFFAPQRFVFIIFASPVVAVVLQLAIVATVFVFVLPLLHHLPDPEEVDDGS
jgi:hypothetical protein